MNLTATPLSWNACLSALRLDRWMMGELGAADAETVGTHVSSCATCSAAVAGIRGVREEVRALPLPGRARPARPPTPDPRSGSGRARPRARRVAGRRLPPAAGRRTVQGRRPRPHDVRPARGGGAARRAGRDRLAGRRGPLRGEHAHPGVRRGAQPRPGGEGLGVLPAGAPGGAGPRGHRGAAARSARGSTPPPARSGCWASSAPRRWSSNRSASALEQGQDGAPLPADCQGLRWSFVKR